MGRQLHAGTILPDHTAVGQNVTEAPIPAKISKVRRISRRTLQTTPNHAKMPPKFVPRQRKHKVIARQKSHGGHSGAGDGAAADANAAEILPAEQREREERKAVMKGELVKEGQAKMSGKKKKRLDKYIVRMAPSSRLDLSVCLRGS